MEFLSTGLAFIALTVLVIKAAWPAMPCSAPPTRVTPEPSLSPPIYRYEWVVTAPAKTIRQIIPAKYKTVKERVVVREGFGRIVVVRDCPWEMAHYVNETVPPEYGYRDRKILVSPEREVITSIPEQRQLVEKLSPWRATASR